MQTTDQILREENTHRLLNRAKALGYTITHIDAEDGEITIHPAATHRYSVEVQPQPRRLLAGLDHRLGSPRPGPSPR